MTDAGIVATFGSAQIEAINLLKAVLSDRAQTAPYAADARVGYRVPTHATLRGDGLPYVLVADDGPAAVTYPIVSTTTLRVTVWHKDADQAWDLANLCHGILLGASGDVLTHCAPSIGPRGGITDPDLGTDLATFQVRATVRGSLA